MRLIIPPQLKVHQRWAKQLIGQTPTAEVFLVGGSVRDLLLKRPTKDYDLVVRNVSKTALQRFLAKNGGVNLVGKTFGVFKFKLRGSLAAELDIALPRTEHTVTGSGSRRDFSVQSNPHLPLTDDLSRRDLTINAMAAHILTGELVDPFDGQKDLRAKTIRAVGEPHKRFAEDYSRMLRAIRFACQLKFKIHPATWSAIKKYAPRINKKIAGQFVVPREIIAKELVLMLRADAVMAIDLLDRSGFLKLLMPELLNMKHCPQPRQWHAEGDVWKHTMMALQNLRSAAFKKAHGADALNDNVIWAALFHDLGKPYTITKTDRIRFNGHETVSAKMWQQAAERLKLASAGVDTAMVELLISRHMILAHGTVDAMKQTTLEKYFFNPQFPGPELLMLTFADIMATVPKSGKPDFSDYKQLQKRLKALSKQGVRRQTLPPPLVNGHDVMKAFKLTASPTIGKLLTIAREAQLRGIIHTKQEGLDLIANHL